MAQALAHLRPQTVWSPAIVARVHVQTLGACQIQIGAERLSPSAETLFSLLLRLVYSPGMRVTRDALMSALWPGQPAPRQRANLRQALYKLRRLGVSMEIDGNDVVAVPEQVARTFAIDRTIEHFERDVLAEHEPFGVFLPGFEPRGIEFKEWIHNCREVVHADVRRVLAGILRSRRERADWREAERIARWLLQFDPLNEEATLTLAECVALAGGKTQAIEMIDRYLEELGENAGEIRLPATTLRRRIIDPGPRRYSLAPTEHHFVGRAEELAQLTLAMRRARWHDGSAFLIHGPPGMGKTRLTYELAKVASIEGMLQLRYSCRESDSTRPLSLALELVSELLAAPGALGCAPETLKHMRRLVGEEPVVLSSAGTPLPREPLPSAGAIRRGIADLVAAVSEEKPIFLVVDDVHWLDRQSWDVLADLVERSEATRVSVLLTSREPHPCAHRPEKVPVRLVVRGLSPLTDAQSTELVMKIIAGERAIDDESLESIMRVSQGVPLFVGTMADQLLECVDGGRLPTTISRILDDRVQLLQPASIRALQLMSLSRSELNIPLIQGALQLNVAETANVLDELSRIGVILKANGSLHCHEFILEAAAQRLTDLSTNLLRARLIESLQRIAAFDNNTLGLLVETCEQLLIIRDTVKASMLIQAIGPDLIDIGRAHQVLGLLDRVRSLKTDCLESEELTAIRLNALFSIGEYSRVLKLLDEKHISATAGNNWDIEHPEEALRLLASSNYIDAQPANEVISRLVLIAESDRVSAPFRLEAARLAIEAAGDLPHPDLAQRAYKSAKAVPNCSDEDEILILRIEMYFHTTFGSMALAESAARRLLTLSDNIRRADEREIVLFHVGICLRFCGERQLAEQLFLRVADEAEKLGMNSLAGRALAKLAYLLMDSGCDEIALVDLLSRAERLSGTDPYLLAHLGVTKARIDVEQNRIRSARKSFQFSFETAPFRNEPKASTYCRAIELAILIGEGRRDMVLASLDVLLERFRALQSFTGQDYLFAQLLSAMKTCDYSVQKAEELARTYLTSRKETSPLPTFVVEQLRRWFVEPKMLDKPKGGVD